MGLAETACWLTVPTSRNRDRGGSTVPNTLNQQRLGRHLKLAALATLAGVIVGLAAWAFLEGLAWATRTRLAHPALLWFLPAAGLATGLAYHLFGGRAGEGNTLLLKEIHEPSAWVPRRMAPLVATATVVSHLFGASVGREGSALQMSGSLTDLLNRTFGVGREDRRVMLIAALGGGFGAVFGAPWAGLVFGIEVQLMGRWKARGPVRELARMLSNRRSARHGATAPDGADSPGPSIDDVAGSPDPLAQAVPNAGGPPGARLRAAVIPSAIASVVGARVVALLGHEEEVRPAFHAALQPKNLLTALVVGMAAGLVAVVFVGLTEAIRHRTNQLLAWPPLRPLVGALMVLAISAVAGHQYLGLSLHLSDQAFAGDVTSLADPLWKLLLTALSLGTGFVGGEVTPMFVMGATLGAAVGHLVGVDPVVGATFGLAAVFAGAAKTPITCTIYAVELFGAGVLLPAAIASFAALAASGRYGVYHQRPEGETTVPRRITNRLVNGHDRDRPRGV